MSITQFEDIAAGYEGHLADDRMDWVTSQIDEAELVLEARLGPLEAWANTPFRLKAVVTVVRRMVLRVLRNPGGYRSESDGDVSYTVDPTVASGALWVTAADWSLLGVGGGKVGTILLGTPYRA